MANCVKCQTSCIFKESKTETFSFPCDLCKNFFCKKCANLSSSEIRVLIMVSRVMPFYCPPCRDNLICIPDLIKRISELEVDAQNQTSETKGKFITIEQRIIKLEDSLNIMTSTINCPSVKPNPTNSESRNLPQTTDVESFITEMEDRRSRARNVIIYNLNESTRSTLTDTITDDSDNVTSILRSLVNNVNIKKIFRIGKNNDNNSKPRPIKIILSSESDAINILKNKSKLDENMQIQIRSDLTIQQRSFLTKLRNELPI